MLEGDALMDRLYAFPIAEAIHYFDYAATALMPQPVIDAWTSYQNTTGVGLNRGRGRLSAAAGASYDDALRRLSRFFSLPEDTAWLLGKNVTEVVNLVAMGLEHRIRPMDYIVVGPFEHHSNFLPWRYLAKRTGAVFMELPVGPDGAVDLEYLELISRHIRVFSYSSVSNVNGYMLDAAPVLDRLPREAIVCCDISQEAGHRRAQVPPRVDVQFLPSHKMYGPKGIAAAVFPAGLLECIQPVLLGGGMVNSVGLDDTWADGDGKYAAGTMDVGLLCAWAAAADFLTETGFETIEAFERTQYGRIRDGLRALDKVELLLPRKPSEAILTFTVKDRHPHDIEYFMSERDIIIRSGHLCTQNSIRKLETDAVNRISLGLGVSDGDIDALLDAMEDVCR